MNSAFSPVCASLAADGFAVWDEELGQGQHLGAWFDALLSLDGGTKRRLSRVKEEIGFVRGRHKEVYHARLNEALSHPKGAAWTREFGGSVPKEAAVALKRMRDLASTLLTNLGHNNMISETESRVSAFDYKGDGGCPAHVDKGLLTIIFSPTAASSLEVETKSGWVAVGSPSTVVVLAGRTLEKLSRGRLVAPRHRVKVAGGRRSYVVKLRAARNHVISKGETVGDLLDEFDKVRHIIMSIALCLHHHYSCLLLRRIAVSTSGRRTKLFPRR
jgi:hypothetical protein